MTYSGDGGPSSGGRAEDGGPSQSTQDKSQTSSMLGSMAQSYEMVNREELQNGQDKGGGATKSDRKTSRSGVTGTDKGHGHTLTASVKQNVQIESQNSTNEGTCEKDGKRSDVKTDGLQKVSEDLQSSVAQLLNSREENNVQRDVTQNVESDARQSSESTSENSVAGKNARLTEEQKKNAYNENEGRQSSQIDRKEDFLSNSSDGRDKIKKSEKTGSVLSDLVPKSSEQLHPHGDGRLLNGDTNVLKPKKEFSQEEKTDAIIVSQNSPGLVSSQNAEVLVALLVHPDRKLQMAALAGVSKCSAFTRNQVSRINLQT